MEASPSVSSGPETTTPQPAATETNVIPQGRHRFSSRWSVNDILGREDGGLELVDKEGTIAGWIRTVRFGNKGKLAFINLNDGSTIHGIQIVCDSNKEGFDQLKLTECSVGASLWVFGKIVKSPGKGQKVEILRRRSALLADVTPLPTPLPARRSIPWNSSASVPICVPAPTLSALWRG
jgi:aspartyl/asparaginyl-tRNA synthetase